MDEQNNNPSTDAQQLGAYRQLISRLPLTLRPSLNQQLSQWETLFPFEQNRAAEFLRGVQSFQPSELDALTRPLRRLENKMGVSGWKFSEERDTVENASLLARSEYYAEWRRAVQQVFETVNAAGHGSARNPAKKTRLVLLVLPDGLPIEPADPWRQWNPRGRQVKIEGDSRGLCELLIQGREGQPGVFALLAGKTGAESSDLWLIDADTRLGSLQPAGQPFAACSLSFVDLKPFRNRFLAGLNTIPKTLESADQVIAALRQQDWERWWPAELAGQTRLRNFVTELFLSGNGALIFSNAFVEWSASEAFRRARPRVLVARFGMRSKPKPFTGLAIFENQQKISALPDVDDPQGSAVDALILARYVWLAVSRFPEQAEACCVCISEHLNSAYLIAPKERMPDWAEERRVTREELCGWIGTQLLA